MGLQIYNDNVAANINISIIILPKNLMYCVIFVGENISYIIKHSIRAFTIKIINESKNGSLIFNFHVLSSMELCRWNSVKRNK